MKKLILICVAAVLATGCGASLFMSASDVANRVQLGMSVGEFKKLAGQHAELDAMTLDGSVYRIDQWAGPADHRYVRGARCYRFDSKGRLVEVETREFVPPFLPDNPFFEPLNREKP